MHLSGANLAREGRHAALGVASLGQLLSRWVVHDLNHLPQVTRVMAKRYRDDVGPWAGVCESCEADPPFAREEGSVNPWSRRGAPLDGIYSRL